MRQLDLLRLKQQQFFEGCSFINSRSEIRTGRLSGTQEELLLAYLDLLIRWNSKMDLVSPAPPDVLLERHIVDSFAASVLIDHLLGLPACDDFIDIGSGAGLPGIVMAIVEPDRKFVLCEPRQKRVAFLKEVVRSLELVNAEVFEGRAESWAQKPIRDGESSFSLAICRALDRKTNFLEISKELVGKQGYLVSMAGPSWEKEQESSCGCNEPQVHLYQLGPNGPYRKLVVWKCFT